MLFTADNDPSARRVHTPKNTNPEAVSAEICMGRLPRYRNMGAYNANFPDITLKTVRPVDIFGTSVPIDEPIDVHCAYLPFTANGRLTLARDPDILSFRFGEDPTSTANGIITFSRSLGYWGLKGYLRVTTEPEVLKIRLVRDSAETQPIEGVYRAIIDACVER